MEWNELWKEYWLGKFGDKYIGLYGLEGRNHGKQRISKNILQCTKYLFSVLLCHNKFSLPIK